MALVTIIIPVYNAEQFLDNCIKSVVNQTYRELEIILVNDGSTDDSATICNCWADQDERIRVIHQKNQGPSIARNVGIEAATGEYLQFVDSDDWIDKDMTKYLVDQMQKSNADIVFCSFLFESQFHSQKCNFFKFTTTVQPICVLWEAIEKTPYHVFFGGVWNKMYKTAMAKQCQFPPDTSQAEDYIFNLQYFIRCCTFCVVENCNYHYRTSQQNSLSTKKRSFEQKTFGWQMIYQHVSKALQKINQEMSCEEASALQIRFFCWMMLDYTFEQMRANRNSIMDMICDAEMQKSACNAKSLAPQHRLFAYMIRHKAFFGLCTLVAIYHFVMNTAEKLHR